MILKAVKPSPKSAGSKSQGYIPEDWTSRQAFIEAEGEKARRTTGKQWTKELIEFFWTHGNTLERSVRSGTCP
jgi:hypothetical protein